MEAFFNHKTIHFQNKFYEQIQKYQYNVELNDGTFLIIIASHLDNAMRFKALVNNHSLFYSKNTHFLIVYSKDQKYNVNLLSLSLENTTLLEMDNNEYYDFGKWEYGLQTIDYSSYHQIIFTNDSFLISSPIPYFFNMSFKMNADFLAYSSSNEYMYHYQTFLFSIKTSAIPRFMEFISSFKTKSHRKQLLTSMEISLYYYFENKQCVVDLGHLDINHKKNIFFHNKALYKILFKANVLPFVKLKMLTNTHKTIPNFVF